MKKDIEKNIEKSVEKKSFSIKVLALIIAAVMVFSMTFMYAKSAFAANTPVFGNVSITMLDVGQGLSVLVESDGEYMLYDGGGRKASRYVVSYLKSKGIDSLKDVVISHFDEDHCAGIVGVLNNFPVQQIYMPNYSTDTKIYSSLISEIKSTETPFCHPYVGDTFYVGSAKAEVLGPAGYDYTDANDDSIIVRISCGTFSCLITGDAEEFLFPMFFLIFFGMLWMAAKVRASSSSSTSSREPSTCARTIFSQSGAAAFCRGPVFLQQKIYDIHFAQISHIMLIVKKSIAAHAYMQAAKHTGLSRREEKR